MQAQNYRIGPEKFFHAFSMRIFSSSEKNVLKCINFRCYAKFKFAGEINIMVGIRCSFFLMYEKKGGKYETEKRKNGGEKLPEKCIDAIKRTRNILSRKQHCVS